jgi:hypothetical protein
VTDLEDAVEILGLSVPRVAEGRPAPSAEERIGNAIRDPSFSQDGTVIRSDAGSPYRVELLVDGRPCGIENRDGLAHAAMDVGQTWSLRIINESEFDCAVRLTIDGLNCFEFSKVPEYRELGMWIVGRKSQAVIRGWHIREGERDTFKVVPAEDSAAGQLGGDRSAIGTITSQFFAAWGAKEPQPPIEPATPRNVGDVGTVPDIRIRDQPEERVTRLIGKTLQSSVSIRYSRPK